MLVKRTRGDQQGLSQTYIFLASGNMSSMACLNISFLFLQVTAGQTLKLGLQTAKTNLALNYSNVSEEDEKKPAGLEPNRYFSCVKKHFLYGMLEYFSLTPSGNCRTDPQIRITDCENGACTELLKC